MDIALKKKNVYNPVEVMNMSKEVKTNAMRMLDKHHIRYDMIQYECDEFIDGLHTAEKTGAPVEQSFKTLVAQGKSKQYYVFVVPIAEEVQLKQAAKVAGEKSVELIPVKEITKITDRKETRSHSSVRRQNCRNSGKSLRWNIRLHDNFWWNQDLLPEAMQNQVHKKQ